MKVFVKLILIAFAIVGVRGGGVQYCDAEISEAPPASADSKT